MMKRLFCIIFVLFTCARAGIAAGGTNSAVGELQALVQQIQTKLNAGKRTPADLADDVKQFDTLLEKHKSEKSDDVARILGMKATLYYEVFQDAPKAIALFEQLAKEFPETPTGKRGPEIVQSIKTQEHAKEMERVLVVGAKFPVFEAKDTTGKALSLEAYKGKLVLLDFWATWCPMCITELPNVLAVYQKYHEQGFEIVGISLDQQLEKMNAFTKARNMPWPQYFDGLGWSNKLVVKYGVNSIPATFLLNKEGVIIGKGLRGPELDSAIAKALGLTAVAGKAKPEVN